MFFILQHFFEANPEKRKGEFLTLEAVIPSMSEDQYESSYSIQAGQTIWNNCESNIIIINDNTQVKNYYKNLNKLVTIAAAKSSLLKSRHTVEDSIPKQSVNTNKSTRRN